MKGILCIKFDLFKIKNTDFWAAYDYCAKVGENLRNILKMTTPWGE